MNSRAGVADFYSSIFIRPCIQLYIFTTERCVYKGCLQTKAE